MFKDGTKEVDCLDIIVGLVQPEVLRHGNKAVVCSHVGVDLPNFTCNLLAKPLPSGIGPIQHPDCPLVQMRSKACEVLID